MLYNPLTEEHARRHEFFGMLQWLVQRLSHFLSESIEDFFYEISFHDFSLITKERGILMVLLWVFLLNTTPLVRP